MYYFGVWCVLAVILQQYIPQDGALPLVQRCEQGLQGVLGIDIGFKGTILPLPGGKTLRQQGSVFSRSARSSSTVLSCIRDNGCPKAESPVSCSRMLIRPNRSR